MGSILHRSSRAVPEGPTADRAPDILSVALDSGYSARVFLPGGCSSKKIRLPVLAFNSPTS
jgi:hypothetical protein